MAIQLSTQYSKKLGLPGYSSHGLTVSITQEVSSPEEIPSVIQQNYKELQHAIDRELQETGWLPDNGAHQAPAQASPNGNHRNGNHVFNGSGRNGSSQQPWNCSEKQKSLIQRVARDQGMSHEDLDALAQTRFRKDIRAINRLEASGLIDELLSVSQPSAQGRAPAYNGVNGRNGR